MGSSHFLPLGSAACLDMLNPTASGNLFVQGHQAQPQAFCLYIRFEWQRHRSGHAASYGIGHSIFAGASGAAPGILPPDPLRGSAAWSGHAASYGIGHSFGSGTTVAAQAFCLQIRFVWQRHVVGTCCIYGIGHSIWFGNFGCGSGILPPDPLRVAAPHGLDAAYGIGHSVWFGGVRCSSGILPPDPLREEASITQKFFPLQQHPALSRQTGCLGRRVKDSRRPKARIRNAVVP